jgi:hypothetical protein
LYSIDPARFLHSVNLKSVIQKRARRNPPMLLQICFLYAELIALFAMAAAVIIRLMGPMTMGVSIPLGLDELHG